jgi:hypothetical protein
VLFCENRVVGADFWLAPGRRLPFGLRRQTRPADRRGWEHFACFRGIGKG